MSYGIIEYNDEGKPKCEICGKHFDRVLAHVRQIHHVNEREYKLRFGFDLSKGICSRSSSEKTRTKTLLNYDTVIKQNLIDNGKTTRFTRGCKGRTKDQVSEQTRIAMIERLNSPHMQEVRKNLGSKLGKSGAGNRKRWKR